MSKFSKLAATAAVLPVLAFSAPAFAASAGQLGGGNTYVAKNLTTASAYGDSTSAACGDTVQYSMELTNTQFGAMDVTLNVSLPSAGGTSTATATTNLGGTTGTSDTTTVNLTSGASQSLVSGTTKLYDDKGHVLSTLPDTVATSGVSIGSLAGSTTEFVNFQAKVNCETPPAKIQVCDLTTKQIVTINESDFNSAKHTKDLTKCQAAPTVLVNTGAGSAVGIAAAVAAVSALAYSVVTRRRLSRQ